MLLVAPRFEQARTFCHTRLLQCTDDSPLLRRKLIGSGARQLRVTHMTFANGSKLFVRAAFLTAHSCRGLGVRRLYIDEYQDIPPTICRSYTSRCLTRKTGARSSTCGRCHKGVILELIANRLLQPKALFRIGAWAAKAGLTDYYGLTVEELNDDRLGRTLQRLAEHADAVQAALVMKAIKVFKLDVSQIHYDITDVELYGAYERALGEGENPTRTLPLDMEAGRQSTSAAETPGRRVRAEDRPAQEHARHGESPQHL